MSLEEYDALMARIQGSTRTAPKKSPGKPRKAKKGVPGMAAAMKEANARMRTKSGKLRKGRTQADVTRLAHKIRRKKYA